jgi:hypothetical protein
MVLKLLLVAFVAGIGWLSFWSAWGYGVLRFLCNFVVLFLCVGPGVGLFVYFITRKTDGRFARSALLTQLVGTPIVVLCMLMGGDR